MSFMGGPSLDGAPLELDVPSDRVGRRLPKGLPLGLRKRPREDDPAAEPSRPQELLRLLRFIAVDPSTKDSVESRLPYPQTPSPCVKSTIPVWGETVAEHVAPDGGSADGGAAAPPPGAGFVSLILV
jgi:hypothetical protein